MADVFVSYKAEDRRRVEPLVRALESDGFSVWWDAHIGGGDRWRQTILDNLEAAPCTIVVWSKRSVGPDGEFVRDEASRALRRRTYLPVRIDKVDPPLGFGETQALPLRGWKGNPDDVRYQAVRHAVSVRVGAFGASRRPPRTKARLSRRSAIAGGLVAVGAVAAGGAWLRFRPSGAKPESIAVLPFENLSGDPAQAYFSDGMAEELRSALSRIPGLKVVARTSSEALRNADAQTAAAKLHVANILTGSVRRSPQTIRVSTQLIDGGNGTERWSEVYDRPAGDSLQIQTDIANMVAQALSINLSAGQGNSLSGGGTHNSEAQDALFQAEAIAWRNDDVPSLQRATELVDRALALDPNYADALTAKASILSYLGMYWAQSAADAHTKSEAGEQYARQAIRIAPRSALAHGALANILWARLELRAGMAEFMAMRALRGSADGFFNGFDPYAVALSQSLRFQAAFDRADQLIAADPLNPNTYLSKGVTLGHARRYQEALQMMQQAAALGPDLIWPRAQQGLYLMEMGQIRDAQAVFDSLQGSGPWLAWAAALAVRQGNRPKADRLVAAMHQSMGDGAYYQYGQVFAQEGNKDAAIAALESGWKAIDPGLAFLQIDPMLDPLRSDARFKGMVKRLDFPS